MADLPGAELFNAGIRPGPQRGLSDLVWAAPPRPVHPPGGRTVAPGLAQYRELAILLSSVPADLDAHAAQLPAVSLATEVLKANTHPVAGQEL